MVMGTSAYLLDRPMAARLRDAGAVAVRSTPRTRPSTTRSGASAVPVRRRCRRYGTAATSVSGIIFLLIVSLICVVTNQTEFYAPSGRRAEASFR